MRENHECDAQLHLLRSFARAVGQSDMRSSHEIETARFNVFAAIQSEDRMQALAWLRSLEAAVKATEDVFSSSIREDALTAIAEIRTGLQHQ